MSFEKSVAPSRQDLVFNPPEISVSLVRGETKLTYRIMFLPMAGVLGWMVSEVLSHPNHSVILRYRPVLARYKRFLFVLFSFSILWSTQTSSSNLV